MTADSKINISRAVNLLFLAYNIMWPAFGVLVVQVDGAGRIGMFLLALVLFFNFSKLDFWKELTNRCVLIKLIWVIYVLVIWNFIGLYYSNSPKWFFVYRKLIMPFVVLFIACYEARRNPIETMRIILLAFFIYVFIGIVFQVGLEGHNGRGGRILGNLLPLTSLPFMALGAMLNVKNKISNWLFGICVILSLYAIFMVATRKALIGAIIILFFWYISKNNIKKASTIILSIVVAVLAYMAYIYVMDYTTIGHRLENTNYLARNIDFRGREYLRFLGDRAIYYIEGWPLFLKNPFFGIGIDNYCIVLPSDMPIHSEYMVQLAETGIIGTVLFVLFYIILFKNMNNFKNVSGDIFTYKTMMGFVLCILFINLSAWTYSFTAFHVVLGVIIGVSNRGMKLNTYINEE